MRCPTPLPLQLEANWKLRLVTCKILNIHKYESTDVHYVINEILTILINSLCAIIYRIFGRLVLVMFVQGESNPHGIEEQQAAENRLTDVFERASASAGMMVGLSRSVAYLCQTRNKELCMDMSREFPEMDNRCRKNYALLISFAEKVIIYVICLYDNCFMFSNK